MGCVGSIAAPTRERQCFAARRSGQHRHPGQQMRSARFERDESENKDTASPWLPQTVVVPLAPAERVRKLSARRMPVRTPHQSREPSRPGFAGTHSRLRFGDRKATVGWHQHRQQRGQPSCSWMPASSQGRMMPKSRREPSWPRGSYYHQRQAAAAASPSTPCQRQNRSSNETRRAPFSPLAAVRAKVGKAISK